MSDFNLENSTAKDPRNNSSLKKSVSSNAVTHPSMFVPHANHPQQARDTARLLEAIDSYEEPNLLNGMEIRGTVRTEDIVDDTDPTVNLHDFFLEQLRESKDRMYLLQLEDQFISLIQDSPHTLHYQHVTSYHRMLIHRMATYFGLHHTLDDEGTGVNVTKIAKSRMPETRFCDLIPAPQEGDVSDKEPVVILRRKYHTEPPIRPNPQIIRPASPPASDSESKSIKQREETYAMVRARIFEGEGPGPDGELVPLKPEDNLLPVEHSSSFISNSIDPDVPQESLLADSTPAPAAVPLPVVTPISRHKEETDLVHGFNSNKTHFTSSAGNSNRRRYETSNRHSRGKNSFPNQPSHQTHFTPQLFVPSNLPCLQLGSFYPQQNEGSMPMYPVHRHPPPATLSTLPLPHSLSLLPTQATIPINNQPFLPHSQHPEGAPYIPSPHMTNSPQTALQLPINPTAAAAVNPALQYPAGFPMVGLQPANSSLLPRTGNPTFQAMPSASDVISYLPQHPPTCEPPKEDAYLYLAGYPNQMGPAYPGVQWEQSGPGVLKLKSQQQQLSPSLSQLTSSLEMMGIHGDEHMYLHPSAKHASPGGDLYPGYSPYPTPNSVQGQGMYMQNNIAFLPYQYQNQDPPLVPHATPMPSSRLILPHPASATASMSLAEPGYPLLTPPLPVRSLLANLNPTTSLTNGQQFLPHGQMLQHTLLHSHLAVANQNLQEFHVNNSNFKNLKHSKSTELLFNQENSRSKSNRYSGSRNASDKSRHRTHQQGSQPMQHKQSGSIYIPPRSGPDAYPQTVDKDGLLPTPPSRRMLEIFELKVSFEEAERCIREIAHVPVEFHSIRSPNTNQEVHLAIFESEQLTDILNKINSNPATKFKTRFPDQNLVKYLSSTILQPTASN